MDRYFTFIPVPVPDAGGFGLGLGVILGTSRVSLHLSSIGLFRSSRELVSGVVLDWG